MYESYRSSFLCESLTCECLTTTNFIIKYIVLTWFEIRVSIEQSAYRFLFKHFLVQLMLFSFGKFPKQPKFCIQVSCIHTLSELVSWYSFLNLGYVFVFEYPLVRQILRWLAALYQCIGRVAWPPLLLFLVVNFLLFWGMEHFILELEPQLFLGRLVWLLLWVLLEAKGLITNQLGFFWLIFLVRESKCHWLIALEIKKWPYIGGSFSFLL